MNGKKAKAIRKEVYGDYSIRYRAYGRDPKKGNIIADDRRRLYQKTKRRAQTNGT